VSAFVPACLQQVTLNSQRGSTGTKRKPTPQPRPTRNPSSKEVWRGGLQSRHSHTPGPTRQTIPSGRRSPRRGLSSTSPTCEPGESAQPRTWLLKNRVSGERTCATGPPWLPGSGLRDTLENRLQVTARRDRFEAVPIRLPPLPGTVTIKGLSGCRPFTVLSPIGGGCKGGEGQFPRMSVDGGCGRLASLKTRPYQL
jgi:hypothetical protein